MIDTLLKHRERVKELEHWRHLGLEPRHYAVLTLHRPSNVDNRQALTGIFSALQKIAEEMPIVFAVHPRTRKQAVEFGL